MRRYYAVYFQLIALSLALAALIQFAYRFPQRSEKDDPSPGQRREARIVLMLSIVAALLVVSQAMYQIMQLKPYGYSHTNTQAINTWLALQIAWVATVLLSFSA